MLLAVGGNLSGAIRQRKFAPFMFAPCAQLAFHRVQATNVGQRRVGAQFIRGARLEEVPAGMSPTANFDNSTLRLPIDAVVGTVGIRLQVTPIACQEFRGAVART